MVAIDDIGQTREALARLVSHLDGNADIGGEPGLGELGKRYNNLKSQHGKDAVAARIGLNAAELQLFDTVLRDMIRRLEPLVAGGEADHNAAIAQLRFYSWLETIEARQSGLSLCPDASPAQTEDIGRKQVRALELIIRSLITERFDDQEGLIVHLTELLSAAVVEKWSASADPDDLLSGTTFSELASLFVNKQEFDRYRDFYESTPFLNYLRDKRKTIQAFLEDIRRVRNVLAHNKRVTPIQLNLLHFYYEELIEPIQEAHDNGETKVNPDDYLQASAEQLDGYFDRLSEDVASVKEDIAEFRAELQQSLGVIAEDTAAIRDTTAAIEQTTTTASRRLIYIGGAVAAILVVGTISYLQVRDTGEDVAEVKETTARTEQAVGEATDAAREAAETSQEVASRMTESTDRIVDTLEVMQESFAALANQGGLIAEPNRPEQFYHNARVYEQRGDYVNARQSYVRFFDFDLQLVDPHLRYQTFLKVQEGRAGAREIYQAMRQTGQGPVLEFATILLEDRERRVARLTEFLDRQPEFAPGFYELSRDYSEARLGTQSLADKRAEQDALNRFIALNESGDYLRYMLDKEMAAAAIDDANSRLAALAAIDLEGTANPVTLSTMNSSAGWTLNMLIAEPAREIFYKLDDGSDFQSTGFNDYVDQRTGAPSPNTMIQLPAKTEVRSIDVRYTDIRGNDNGPFTLTFEPGSALFQGQKDIVELLYTTWITYREWEGDQLAYFSALMGYRCAISEIRYSLDTDDVDQKWPISACDPDNPNAVSQDDTLLMKIPDSTRFVAVQVQYADGTESEVHRFPR